MYTMYAERTPNINQNLLGNEHTLTYVDAILRSVTTLIPFHRHQILLFRVNLCHSLTSLWLKNDLMFNLLLVVLNTTFKINKPNTEKKIFYNCINENYCKMKVQVWTYLPWQHTLVKAIHSISREATKTRSSRPGDLSMVKHCPNIAKEAHLVRNVTIRNTMTL